MALRSLICPQCGAQLQIEDTDRDYGFCTYCGTKVQLNEIVSVKHSGSVTLDNSAQANNRLAIANRAFSAQNYAEAMEYYTKALEDRPEDYVALYRKGICAIYLSALENIRTNEFATFLDTAKTALNKIVDQNKKSELILQKDVDLNNLLNVLYAQENRRFATQSCKNDCIAIMTRLYAIAMFARLTSLYFVDTEEMKERVLFPAIKYCDELLRLKIEYISGIYTDKKGNPTNVMGFYSLNGQTKEKVIEIRQELAAAFNNLPSRKARDNKLNSNVNQLNAEINELKTDIKAKEKELKITKKNYLKVNEEYCKGYKKAILPSTILLISSLLVGIIVLFFIFPFGLLIIGVGIWACKYLRDSASKKYEQRNLSESVLQQEQNLANEKKLLKEKETALKNGKKDLNTFNKTKM